MTGTCEHCGHTFEMSLEHCGFGYCSYAYCDQCGKTAILSGWSKEWPNGVSFTQEEISLEMEPYLERCPCGGRFAKGAAPRCPSCHQPLSAEYAAKYIEAQALGARKGWRWQRNWKGLYVVVIERLLIENNFKRVEKEKAPIISD